VESRSRAGAQAVPAYLAALAAGVVLAVVKLVYSFLPLFNVLDVVAFGGVGMLLGRWRRGTWWLRGILLAIPALVLSLLFCARLGSYQLRAGIGVGWAVSAVVVPLAALVGAYLGFGRARGGNALSQPTGG
jgi:hypothetical protein